MCFQIAKKRLQHPVVITLLLSRTQQHTSGTDWQQFQVKTRRDIYHTFLRQKKGSALEAKASVMAGGRSKVLLSLLLGVHGIQDGLPLGVVATPKVLNLPLHVRIKA